MSELDDLLKRLPEGALEREGIIALLENARAGKIPIEDVIKKYKDSPTLWPILLEEMTDEEWLNYNLETPHEETDDT